MLSLEVCLTADHEVLTQQRGWQPIAMVEAGESVWSLSEPMDGEKSSMQFVEVTRTHELAAPDTLIRLHGPALECIATPAHRWPVQRDTMEWRRTDELDGSMQLIAVGCNNNLAQPSIVEYLSCSLYDFGASLADTVPSDLAASLCISTAWISHLSAQQARSIIDGFLSRSSKHSPIVTPRICDIVQFIGLLAGVHIIADVEQEEHDAWRLSHWIAASHRPWQLLRMD